MIHTPINSVRAPFFFAVLLTTLLALAGCNTFERRAQKKADVFATLSPETRARLEKEIIQVGDSADMVYIALGAPDQKRGTTTGAGETITWIYTRQWQEYQGQAHGGFVQRAIRDPKTGATVVYLEPVSRPVYATREQPVQRIFFTDGKVSVIEKIRE